MQVFGNIGTEPKERISSNGRTYWEFRLAESQRRRNQDQPQNGERDENERTTWYTVRAFIPELDADMLGTGMFVKVTGQLEIGAYVSRKDGKPVGTATILTSSVVPVQRRLRAEESE